jgi:hypothetical protein
MAHIRTSRPPPRLKGDVAIEVAQPAPLMFPLGIMDAGRLLWAFTTLATATE